MHFIRLNGLVSFGVALCLSGSLLGQATPPSSERPRDVLPEPDDWERFRDGVRQAETFRRELLNSQNSPSGFAGNLIDRILEFQTACASALDPNRPGIARFDISRDRLLQCLESDPNISELGSGFDEFHGEWFGSWDTFDVDHDWSRSLAPDPPWKIEGEDLALEVTEIQYAWIGDGFGWNVVVSPLDNSNSKIILGAVYHSSVEAPRKVRFFRPHVGARPGPNQLIWITRGEVFFEEVRPAHQDYVITGFHYERDAFDKVHFRGGGFQAIYSRDPTRRTPFHQFTLSAP